MNTQELFENAVADGIRKGVVDRLSGYNSPVEKLLTECIKQYEANFRTMIDDGIKSCVNDEEFKTSIQAAIRQSLAKLLVQRFGGELEKQVNALKSDPTTRARIVLALDEIVKSQLK